MISPPTVSKMTTLPTLDFSKFTDGSDVERQELGRSITQSFMDHGFVKLVNHGLPDETIAELLDLVCLFVCNSPHTLVDS